jgi:hypothetical protein
MRIPAIEFTDGDTGGPGFVGLRAEGTHVGLAVSLAANGDIEVFLDSRAVDEVIAALTSARRLISDVPK